MLEQLHRFAKRFERFLINRGSIFKDGNRKGWIYPRMCVLADTVAHVAAATMLKLR